MSIVSSNTQQIHTTFTKCYMDVLPFDFIEVYRKLMSSGIPSKEREKKKVSFNIIVIGHFIVYPLQNVTCELSIYCTKDIYNISG